MEFKTHFEVYDESYLSLNGYVGNSAGVEVEIYPAESISDALRLNTGLEAGVPTYSNPSDINSIGTRAKDIFEYMSYCKSHANDIKSDDASAEED